MLSAIICPAVEELRYRYTLMLFVKDTDSSSSKNLYVKGNVWNKAASLAEIALSWIGWPKRPFPIHVHCVVMVGERLIPFHSAIHTSQNFARLLFMAFQIRSWGQDFQLPPFWSGLNSCKIEDYSMLHLWSGSLGSDSPALRGGRFAIVSPNSYIFYLLYAFWALRKPSQI